MFLCIVLSEKEAINHCERLEPRSHFKSRLSLIVLVNVVLNRTVVVDGDWRFDNLCGSHLQSQSELYLVSWWYYTLVIDLAPVVQTLDSTIQRISVMEINYAIRWIVIYPVDSAIQLLNNLGLIGQLRRDVIGRRSVKPWCYWPWRLVISENERAILRLLIRL